MRGLLYRAGMPAFAIDDLDDHELVSACRQAGHPLSARLVAMLGEHHSHATERRGCGYTQATRHLAEFINESDRHHGDRDLCILTEPGRRGLLEFQHKAAEVGLAGPWRNLDLHDPPSALHSHDELLALYHREARRQARWRRLPAHLKLEESVILARMLCDTLLPVDATRTGAAQLALHPEPLAIGTCPLAEKYFLELAHGFVRRQGAVNVIVDPRGRPVLVEKVKLGDSQSCIAVRQCVLSGTRLPPGSLIGVAHRRGARRRANRTLPGSVIPLADCAGFRFLRLTTLAVTPGARARAFTTHFETQVAGGLFSPDKVRIEQILAVAEQQLD